MKTNNDNSGKLIVLGTPIGNLGDFSSRGIQALRDSDLIAAEDTRITRKLLHRFDIRSKHLLSYFEYSGNGRLKIILKKILDGKDVVFVSDAGMPTISDPGENLIKECINSGIKIEVVPGPSALTAALAVSGLSTRRFTFEGFLSKNKKQRKKHLEELKNEKRTMVFYESPHNLFTTLDCLFELFGNRKISICRELTKIYEEIIRTTLSCAKQLYKDKKAIGEFVLVVEGKEPHQNQGTLKVEDVVLLAQNLIKQGQSINNAAKETAKQTGFKKSDIYKALLKNLAVNNTLEFF
ncbi:MAG: 16S rRNA (cytidine(1402)-2'-O)-methyltransferase [Oscillospiraceae bacterium]|jgi:16S rRNA (cytidine1402-2'-O)-methyltransferase|nr:16S rRNA (cytidine(1402)-2'-O)-methyltransferase [Oscillospiraceae bacterium]